MSFILECNTIQSCKKKSDVTLEPQVPVVAPFVSSFYSKVNGTEFAETEVTVDGSQGNLFITASLNGGFPKLGIRVPTDVAAGTYTLTDSGLYNGFSLVHSPLRF